MTHRTGRASSTAPATEALADAWRRSGTLEAHPTGEWVPWEAVEVREDVLPRKLKQHWADDLAHVVRDDPHALPPLLVQKDTFILASGLHRLHAFAQVGDHVPIIEVDRPLDELSELAFEENIGQRGLPMTRAEIAAYGRVLLRLNPDWTDGAIAKKCGVSDRTVRRWRAEVAPVETRTNVLDFKPPDRSAEPEQVRTNPETGRTYTLPPTSTSTIRSAPAPKPKRRAPQSGATLRDVYAQYRDHIPPVDEIADEYLPGVVEQIEADLTETRRFERELERQLIAARERMHGATEVDPEPEEEQAAMFAAATPEWRH